MHMKATTLPKVSKDVCSVTASMILHALTACPAGIIYSLWCAHAGNDTALADLLAAEAPDLANTWRQTWDLAEGSVTLDPAFAEGNPLLAAVLALHKESCRLLYASGALPQGGEVVQMRQRSQATH